ncbi:lactosylceramide 1,3-N-acetyl-beta-D-glucosaminyltransferase A [Callorhinchus milii]|uniref:Hexosyltransferase n=1 Tax=Callorhinchus milii TaxID=7868 RepID=A0A4W3I5L4_CALMI|nr:lactosylceramide 1,3-N-acetyl-beta-D-glucosaminyltransferase A [Callorhinchus milii]XP_007910011.1 lactosylceramide 1,3-N-acetyl-beta-D-glucosaminyltransferase A [Callorhinchus milii]XP_042195156.1 lactosylceramide 1,3-N-acetyl-beta-D-glucosaminyltransferase A [Callorhinchus milii]XP_042195157.1 lactosylceramide 1,3-N-acetyl-beta-D-glucosaminyltransferase A [Callorhinchus milii]|eukprot:gi/632986022/ref/XP_007910009.1/ PREDICTED: lactosylceramide 1,3-N-acetyl-beta-D-glucosaminyltransferase [Callorhinchus milii]
MMPVYRRGRKRQFVQLVATCFLFSLVLIYWEQLDANVVSHVKSYSYRYLINQYGFLNDSLTLDREIAANLYGFQYLMNHEDKCHGQEVLLLLFVKSSPENRLRRDSIRETWGNEYYIYSTLKATIKVIFVLGVDKNVHRRHLTQQELMLENRQYADLIQQDFYDDFHNLTLKLIFQFKWANTYCQNAKFVMSSDDDVFVHTPNLVTYLQELNRKGISDFWIGRVHRGAPPVRSKASKYYVSYEMYQWPAYPDYTAGAAYVVSQDVAVKIYEALMTLNSSLYIDDVFMGMCAKKMGVSPQYHAFFAGEGKAPYHPCIYEKMMTSHGHVNDIHHLWREATDPKVSYLTTGVWGKLYCRLVKIFLLCKPYYLDTYPCVSAFS